MAVVQSVFSFRLLRDGMAGRNCCWQLHRRAIWLALILAAQSDLAAGSGDKVSIDVPAVHLVRERVNLGQRRLVRMQRRQCLDERKNLSRIRRESPEAWSGFSQARPGYDPDRPLAADPEWSSVAVDREEEFFDHHRYALYRHGYEYGIARNGSCALTVRARESREIDDGVYAWSVDVVEKTISRTMSQARRNKRIDSERQAGLDSLPGSREMVARLLAQAGLFDAIGVAGEAFRRKGSMIIAGQPAECMVMGEQELCYWQRLPMYPGAVERPVILRSVVVFAGSRNVAAVNRFRVLANIPASVFKLPQGYRETGDAEEPQ